MRCMLFVPGDSEKKLSKAEGLNVDAVIVDLEDAVAPDERAKARELARDFAARNAHAWVRINPWSTPDADKDLEVIMAGNPAGIVLPKALGPEDVHQLASRLDGLEILHGIEAGRTKILSLCTERVRALFTLGDYVNASARLLGLSWGAEDLSSELGARTNRDAAGEWLPPYQMARSLCLFAARSAEVLALDTVYTDFRNAEGLSTYANHAARDGFDGMLAIHPAQIDIIQKAFSPSDDDVLRAQKIIELFAGNAGVVSLDGQMLDRPHLLQAERILGKHRASQT